MIWIIGEYAERIDQSTSQLTGRSNESFDDETPQVYCRCPLSTLDEALSEAAFLPSPPPRRPPGPLAQQGYSDNFACAINALGGCSRPTPGEARGPSREAWHHSTINLHARPAALRAADPQRAVPAALDPAKAKEQQAAAAVPCWGRCQAWLDVRHGAAAVARDDPPGVGAPAGIRGADARPAP